MKTKTLSQTEDGAGHAAWERSAYLVLAMDCRRPTGASARFSLAETDLVVVGRGDSRGAIRSGRENARELRIDVDDGWMSTDHFRLTASGSGVWVLNDAGSKNGTRVNGHKRTHCELCDGDVLEVGHTFLVFRDTGLGAPDVLEVRGSETDPPSLVTLSAGLGRDCEILARVARSKVAVIVYGESGTGKEVAARDLHRASRRTGRFVALNCGALSETLVEAELFGAEKGAFSGATERREGLVRAADGGTLFLDEIATLPESCQATLLRVLQEGEVLPIGSTRPVAVDLRVVAATNSDLGELADRGDFRPDLYARLKGFELELPPLRERCEDLGVLVSSLLGRLAGERASALSLQTRAARSMFRYAWPFNVRELAQALAAAVAIAEGDEIQLEHLPKELRVEAANPERPKPAPRSRPPGAEELLALLREHAGNVSAVARAMYTSRSHVRRLAERFGIDLESYRS